MPVLLVEDDLALRAAVRDGLSASGTGCRPSRTLLGHRSATRCAARVSGGSL